MLITNQMDDSPTAAELIQYGGSLEFHVTFSISHYISTLDNLGVAPPGCFAAEAGLGREVGGPRMNTSFPFVRLVLST